MFMCTYICELLVVVCAMNVSLICFLPLRSWFEMRGDIELEVSVRFVGEFYLQREGNKWIG